MVDGTLTPREFITRAEEGRPNLGHISRVTSNPHGEGHHRSRLLSSSTLVISQTSHLTGYLDCIR